jgi:hypothetical protein
VKFDHFRSEPAYPACEGAVGKTAAGPAALQAARHDCPGRRSEGREIELDDRGHSFGNLQAL